MIYRINITLAIILLFCLLVNSYKIVYCNDNGYAPQEPLSSLASLSFTTGPSPIIYSSGTVPPVHTSFREAVIVRTTSDVSENFFFSDSSNWNIVIGSIRGILGVALLTVTIFFIRRARQKYPLLEEASISDFSTDNANQTKCSSKLETVEQRKGTDNEGKMVDNVRRTEAVRVIAMDDSKSSFAQQGPSQKIQTKKNTTATSEGDIKESGDMKQEEVGAQEQGHISRALGFIEFTPRQLPSIIADGVRCLRSQSAPNLRWFRVHKTVRPIVSDVPDCPQQAVLLGESNSATEEQNFELENNKSKNKTPAKSFSVVFWKKQSVESSLPPVFIVQTDHLKILGWYIIPQSNLDHPQHQDP
ncbi:hypothetical protein G6F70_007768 [Rhizopus microsporus]|nr:hypothetical protein G6F71_009145 [Rhizopus microsporus]KAG1196021.1 hypothetical protein G6F70_007768 [Rhizopus microsporus]KAG1207736.1 hypothetical protein G6F69_007798 [Rhizopus microsporus]KAG1228638.1 hypothetical protein G6F67_007691 [Rhizopus microsporus]KAG1260756.1 hypothetical protein G6F68_007199 [Rhizopus microsporus]